MKQFRLFVLISSCLLLCACTSQDQEAQRPIPEPKAKSTEVKSITFSSNAKTLSVGNTYQLETSYRPENAPKPRLNYRSDDSQIASVSETGLVTALKYGTAIITASTANNRVAVCKITVKKELIPVNSVSLDNSTLTLFEQEGATLTASVLPEDADNQELSWSSDNEEVVTVNNYGFIKALKAGSATITVTTQDGGKTATCRITVEHRAIEVASIRLSQQRKTLFVGDELMLSVTFTPENPDNKSLSWSSSNEQVASVDQEGKVSAKAQGEAVITVRSANGKEDRCDISVAVQTNDDNLGGGDNEDDGSDDLPDNPDLPDIPDIDIPDLDDNTPKAIILHFQRTGSTLKFLSKVGNNKIGTELGSDAFIDIDGDGNKGENNREGIHFDQIYTIAGTSVKIYGDVSALAIEAGDISSVESNSRLTKLYLKENNSNTFELRCPELTELEISYGTNSSKTRLSNLRLTGASKLNKLNVDYCNLSTIDFSNAPAIRHISVLKNNIKREGARRMFESLPTVNSGTILFLNGKRDTHNETTRADVTDLTNKGWQIQSNGKPYTPDN